MEFQSVVFVVIAPDGPQGGWECEIGRERAEAVLAVYKFTLLP